MAQVIAISLFISNSSRASYLSCGPGPSGTANTSPYVYYGSRIGTPSEGATPLLRAPAGGAQTPWAAVRNFRFSSPNSAWQAPMGSPAPMSSGPARHRRRWAKLLRLRARGPFHPSSTPPPPASGRGGPSVPTPCCDKSDSATVPPAAASQAAARRGSAPARVCTSHAVPSPAPSCRPSPLFPHHPTTSSGRAKGTNFTENNFSCRIAASFPCPP